MLALPLRTWSEGFVGVAQVGKILLLANRFLRELQHAFQKAFVQLHHVELLLAGDRPATGIAAAAWASARGMRGWR